MELVIYMLFLLSKYDIFVATQNLLSVHTDILNTIYYIVSKCYQISQKQFMSHWITVEDQMSKNKCNFN